MGGRRLLFDNTSLVFLANGKMSALNSGRSPQAGYNLLMQATYDDANLILKLYELRREETLRKARAWFGANFNAANAQEVMQKYPPGSPENTNIRMVVSYWDMVASFVTAGVLNQELFFQSGGELLFVWEKLRGIVDTFRQMTKNPHQWANLETVGNAYIKFVESRGPEAYATFQAMIKAIPASESAAAAKP
jgi:hypothetical protein